jgi:alkanesulfonate monooxygenase SsuD/methylene tetrahydromethanopterin reductase-like flavin-dependent oxidoreductase (luciferase family)
MARIAGEVAEGFHVHPLHSVRYLSEVVRPAIVEGATAAGRSAAAVQLAVPVFLAVGETDDELRRRRDAIRRQIGFYGSTPSYRPVFELHGWATRRERNAACSDGRDRRCVLGDGDMGSDRGCAPRPL